MSAEKKSQAVFEVHKLKKQFNGKTVLSIPHLVFNEARIYCLYGHNGSGKTTLFELLTLLQRPTKGRIIFRGKEIHPARDGIGSVRAKATLVHQNPLLFDTTIERNVDYGLRVRNIPHNKRKKRVDECLSIVGLRGYQKRKARELSGGEAQRVAIARGLCINPEVILLDEFSANIDYENRVIIEKIIKTINMQLGTTILFTTHYLDQAYRLADEVIHLHKGKIVSPHIRNIYKGIIKKSPEGTVFSNDKIKLFVISAYEGEASVCIPVNAVTVSCKPFDSSMRNCLEGHITHVIDDGNDVILRILAGEFFETVITKESFRKLGIIPGMVVYLNFKATSVEVL